MTESFNVPVNVPMSNGAVLKCRAVPPYASIVVRRKMPEPPFPKVKVKSATGSEEIHPALPGTKEHEEYRQAQYEYRQKISAMMYDFNINYGVLAWQLPGEDEWTEQPPEDWEVPEILHGYGIKTSDDPMERRAQYIQYELMITERDSDAVDSMLLPQSPLSKEEILAALAPFGSNDQVDLSSILKAVLQV